jgi:hypothetical protein
LLERANPRYSRTGAFRQGLANALVPSAMSGKIVSSAVFIDFRITDAITDKNREYLASFVISIKKKLNCYKIE